MDSDERREVVKRFWCRVQKVIGLVPRRVMGLLDLFEMSASQLIAKAETDWATCIEAEVKAKGGEMFDDAVKRGFTRTKSEVFGLQQNELDKFKLLDSEKASIDDLRKLIQDNGVRSYIIESPARATRRGAPTAQQSNVVLTSGQLKQILLDKLACYYRKRKSLGINSNFFVDVQVVTESESENQAKVRVPCPKCNQKPGCTRNGNTWLTNNYYQHVRTHIARRSTRPGRASRRNSGVDNRRRSGQHRSVAAGSVTEEDGEDGPRASSPVDTDEDRGEEVRQGTSSEGTSASRSAQVPPAPSVTDAERGENSVEDRGVEKAAGSGSGQSRRHKSVTELVLQFSGEGTSQHYRDTSEN